MGLPNWCVCAGFVRSKVWDYLHGFKKTHLPDVDVVFFDADNTDESIEKEYERILRDLDSSVPWSVKNQARMHIKSGHAPFISTADGLSHFPEVCTAIGVYLDPNGEVTLITPYGVEDLVNLIVRPTPFFNSGDKLTTTKNESHQKNGTLHGIVFVLLFRNKSKKKRKHGVVIRVTGNEG